MIKNIDDCENYFHSNNCAKLEESYRRNSTDESGSVNIKFENITESFLNKYIRYSERLINSSKQIENNNEESSMKRKVYSADDTVNTNETVLSKSSKKSFLYSPFNLVKSQKSENQESFSNQTEKSDDFKKSLLSEKFKLEKKEDKHLRYTLPRKKNVKKIFEEFIVLGIENTGLEYIDDLEELLMTPKIIYNFPNKLNENELKFNIKFLKNFCFNEGVKVTRNEISTDTEFDLVVLERNFFSKPKSYFCLVQQISPEDIQKYFIFGIRFEDFYVVPCSGLRNQSRSNSHIVDKSERNYKKSSSNSCSLSIINDTELLSLKKTNYVKIFTYEKTYLFISTEPVCELFEQILQSILNIKKLNFLNNFSDFSSIFVSKLREHFTTENSEKVNLYYSKGLFKFNILAWCANKRNTYILL